MNDGALTAEALKLRFDGYDPGLAVYPSPDFATIARGFGWKAVTIDQKRQHQEIHDRSSLGEWSAADRRSHLARGRHRSGLRERS